MASSLDEFGMGSSALNGTYFAACNPWKTDRVAGRSSGALSAAHQCQLYTDYHPKRPPGFSTD